VVLWFVGTAVVTVWFVFRDPRFDYRVLALGAVLPDLVDGVWGGARALHSVVTAVVVLIVVVLATIGRREARRRWLALPIGMFLHLVFDGAFAQTRVFWWPLGGAGFDDAPLPSVDRGWTSLVLDLVGALALVWVWRHFGLADPQARRRLWRTGQLLEPHSTSPAPPTC
jgi:hypothetical protein